MFWKQTLFFPVIDRLTKSLSRRGRGARPWNHPTNHHKLRRYMLYMLVEKPFPVMAGLWLFFSPHMGCSSCMPIFFGIAFLAFQDGAGSNVGWPTNHGSFFELNIPPFPTRGRAITPICFSYQYPTYIHEICFPFLSPYIPNTVIRCSLYHQHVLSKFPTVLAAYILNKLLVPTWITFLQFHAVSLSSSGHLCWSYHPPNSLQNAKSTQTYGGFLK